ncbi:galactan export ABC transporter ATP-binding subunit Wzt/RfbE [Prauserella rugosa]|uniref:ABC-2 type transport system ATP-binding protein n=1 Tax=Prauserella rugosa TaxID=43354 RepID=A0A660CET6_9PSEU|nr:ABC transporter ATP-binding protein [Prauserella rugosa]KMS87743.1 ABC transporter ATP-binding protein [Streptomyces regensis]TWH21922.1 ABC-2 type transport system ATP-binding protein [Prauserella rugosa]
MVSIDVRNAYVDFPIFDAKTRSMKKRVLGKVGGKIGSDSKVPIIEALQDVNLQLREGDRLALVGHNGAGKSTLLRLLSGIYEPTRGSARVTGKVAPVFDLGVGMDPETSGFENIIVRGLFLGKSRKEMEKRIDDIAEFTELGDYLAMPLRTYSTGMRVRLALGVVTSIDPEILILDEGLGAVDASFMNKARDRLKDLVKRSGILVFASHSDELLLELCDQAMWMDEGRVRQHGRLREVLTGYKGRDPFQNVSREVLERLGQANPDDAAAAAPAGQANGG